MKDRPPSGRGGKRPGSGRKKRDLLIVTYSVHITTEQADLLKEWGNGDVSAGLRWLVDAARLLVRKIPKNKDSCAVGAPGYSLPANAGRRPGGEEKS